jgi:putative hydrolase of the HAD superfamily
MQHNIQLVSFDIWGTLLTSNPVFSPARTELFARVFNKPIDEVRAAVREADIAADNDSEHDGIDRDLKDRLKRIGELLHTPLTLSGDDLKAFESDLRMLALQFPPMLIDPNTIQILTDLRAKGFKIGLLSNTGFFSGTTMRAILEKVGVLQLTDVQVFSNELGFAKPDPRIFMQLAEATGVPAEHTSETTKRQT